MNYKILKYTDENATNPNIVGGKAGSLSILFRNGLNVPDGRIVICKNEDENHDINYIEIQKISKIIEKEFGKNMYAARSSAVGEDGEKNSFAGCFESYLNISPQGLTEAICKCWQSIRNDRVKAYCSLSGITMPNRMSVIVQEYINANVHGVAFSKNPVTSDNNTLVLELQHGQSGNVVGGIGQSTTIFSSRDSLFFESNGILLRSIEKELFAIVLQIEKLLNHAVDIEWVVANNTLFITQARMLTS